jgi:hypothetical protein
MSRTLMPDVHDLRFSAWNNPALLYHYAPTVLFRRFNMQRAVIRALAVSAAVVAVGFPLNSARVGAQQKAPEKPAAPSGQHMGSMEMSGGSKMTDAQKIANAMSAGPASLTKNATIMDWPAEPNGKPRQLRAGTNGWVCYPSTPEAAGAPKAATQDPMCLDKSWQGWAEAYMSKKTPQLMGTGVGYMLKGDRGASNTDPFAEKATATNNWVVAGPHIMIVYPDAKMLDAYPTDPKSGGPWVMWKGTPYAHVMVPVSSTAMATMPMMK